MSTAAELTQAQYKQVREAVANTISGYRGHGLPDPDSDDFVRAELVLDAGMIDIGAVLK